MSDMAETFYGLIQAVTSSCIPLRSLLPRLAISRYFEENVTTRPTLPIQAAQHLGLANRSTLAEFKEFGGSLTLVDDV